MFFSSQSCTRSLPGPGCRADVAFDMHSLRDLDVAASSGTDSSLLQNVLWDLDREFAPSPHLVRAGSFQRKPWTAKPRHR